MPGRQQKITDIIAPIKIDLENAKKADSLAIKFFSNLGKSAERRPELFTFSCGTFFENYYIWFLFTAERNAFFLVLLIVLGI